MGGVRGVVLLYLNREIGIDKSLLKSDISASNEREWCSSRSSWS